MKYTLVSGRHSRTENGVRVSYAPGDPIELTAEEAKSAGARVKPLGWPAEAVESPPAGGEKSALAEDLAGKNTAQVIDLLALLAETAEVEEVRAAELEGHARKGVLKACDERLEQLAVPK